MPLVDCSLIVSTFTKTTFSTKFIFQLSPGSTVRTYLPNLKTIPLSLSLIV